MYIGIYRHICIYVSKYMYIHTHIYTYVHIYVYILKYGKIDLNMYKIINRCINIYI